MEKKFNGFSLAAIICGVAGVVMIFLPVPLIVALLGLVLGILAIVFASIGMKKAKATGTGRGLAIAGLVTGIVATALIGIVALCLVCAVALAASGAAAAAIVLL